MNARYQELNSELAAMAEGEELSGSFEWDSDTHSYSITRRGSGYELSIDSSATPYPGAVPEVWSSGVAYYAGIPEVRGALGGLGF